MRKSVRLVSGKQHKGVNFKIETIGEKVQRQYRLTSDNVYDQM